MDTEPISNRCPKCQSPLPADAPQGLCPRCLLAAVATPTEAGQPAQRPAAPPLEQVAAAFPQLEILEFIGQGGMGFVFKARQPRLDRLVALKILPQSLATDPAFAERFHREARLLARLNHPGIVTVHDFGVATGRAGNPLPAANEDDPERRARSDAPYLAQIPHSALRVPRFYYLLMEFVDGVNLRQAMQAGRFTPEQALAIVPKICEALQFAHNEGILHRDIKPENILLDAKGRVKIADFGIAKLVGDVAQASQPAGDLGIPAQVNDSGLANREQGCSQNPQAGKPALQALTEAGKALGTPNYMAPEQLANAGDVDHRADIYSLGVVFYEMLTGELPTGRFAPPSQKSAADPRVDEVVLRALEKEKAKRYATAEEVRTQVETIVTSSSGRESAPTDDGGSKGNRRNVVRLAWTVGLSACLLISLANAVSTFLLPKSYLATARLNIDSWPSGVASLQARDPIYLQTQFEIIRGNAVLENVVALANLTEKWGNKFNNGVPLPVLQATELLRNRLYIRPIRSTSYIEVGCYSDSPQEAAVLANVIAIAYTNSYTQLEIVRFQVAQHELEKQLEAAEAKIATTKKGLAKLQGELQIPDGIALLAEAPDSATHEHAKYWKKKRELEQQTGFRDLLSRRIILEKADHEVALGNSPVTITDKAVPPTRPDKPNVPWSLSIGVLCGAAVGLLAGWTVLGVARLRGRRTINSRSSRGDGAQTEAKPPTQDWLTWSPLQSQEYGDICAHLNKAERRHASVLWLLITVCVLGTTFGIPALLRSNLGEGKWTLVTVWVALFFPTLLGIQRLLKHFLCSTEWARQRGFTPDKLPLFSPSRRNLALAGVVLAMGSISIFIQHEAIKRYLGPSSVVTTESALATHAKAQLDSSSSTFGPVVERVIPINEQGLSEVLNLDSSKITPRPVNWNFGIAPHDRLPGDISFYAIEDKMINCSGNTVIETLTKDEWEKMQAEMAQNKAAAMFVSGASVRDEELPKTFLFKTGDGNIGLLQITGFTENPRGVKLRYKLVESTTLDATKEPITRGRDTTQALQHADQTLKDAGAKFDAGHITLNDLQRAKYNRDIAAAELRDDRVEVARLKLAVAELDLEAAEKKWSVRRGTKQEYERARIERNSAMIRHQSLRNALVTATNDPALKPIPTEAVALYQELNDWIKSGCDGDPLIRREATNARLDADSKKLETLLEDTIAGPLLAEVRRLKNALAQAYEKHDEDEGQRLMQEMSVVSHQIQELVGPTNSLTSP